MAVNNDTTKQEKPTETEQAKEQPKQPAEAVQTPETAPLHNIVNRNIVDEMKTNYIDYSMSVIVSRALPDVRDGLKPSQRRILVVLNDLGLTPTAHYRKSAKICGDTTGNYHPHGESIVYPTLVKLAQEFSMRYRLVDGQGNFGSIDGDSPAQMRYTEARMTKITQELLRDLDKGTVLYTPNYDGTRLEPTVLPSAFPNLICNGAEGIAVGMATKIPPHNLGEVVDALQAMIEKGNKWKGSPIYNGLRKAREKTEKIPQVLPEKPLAYTDSYVNPKDPKFEEKLDELNTRLKAATQAESETENEERDSLYPKFESDITVEELMKFIPGPDFPTAGQIYNQKDIMEAYATGRGRVLMRAKASIVEANNGRYQIIVTEIPFEVNKAHLIEKIASLVKNKHIEGISDLRDESNREGIRVVIELKKAVQPKTVLNKLYKFTEMQKAYNTNMIALVNGQPETLSLKEILEYYIDHRIEVTIRKFEFEIAQAKYRAHILEGLKIALDHLDEVIKTIRASKTQEDAKANLIKKFDLTDVQAQAILDLQLRRLAALERQKIEDELKTVLSNIAALELLLADPDKILKTVATDLKELKEKHADERRTKVFKGKVDEIAEDDLVAAEETFVTLSHSGYIKRMPPNTYKVQNRGGKGVSGASIKEDDYIEYAITCNTHDNIIFFTNKGRAFEIRAYEIPEFSRTAKGIPAVNLIQLEQDERITSLLNRSKKGIVSEEDQQLGEAAQPNKFLFMATKSGTVKKTELSQFEKIRSTGIICIKLDKGDDLKWVKPTNGDTEVILVTKGGKSIRFHEKDVRETGRNTRGVMGIRLKGNDEVISMDAILKSMTMLLTVSENGNGKMTDLKEYATQGRGGQGVFTFRVTDKTGPLIAATTIDNLEKEMVIISREGQVIRSAVKQIPKLGRQTSGVRIMKMNAGDSVAAMAFI